jgi:hypothetical protein
MMKRALIRRNAPDEMECGACGGTMRLYGIEAHPAIGGTDLQTYVCLRCDHMQTKAVPAPGKRKGAPMNGHAQEDAFDAETTRLLGAVFDAAWEAVLASDRPPVDPGHAATVREALAKRILERVRHGERDPRRLVADALRLWQGSQAAKIELPTE